METLHRRLDSFLWPEAGLGTGIRARSLSVARYVYALLRDLAGGELSLRAMSLVYTTMLAIVPLLAFSFAVLKGLGFHRQLEPLLLRALAPIGPRAGEIAANVVGFVDNISGSVLAGLSVGFLLYAALSMAQKVEASFNFVWRVDRPRSFARRFTEYLSVMLVGPIVMLVTMGVIATLASTTLVNKLRGIQPIGAWIANLNDLMPYMFVIAAFSFLYMFIPNARVRLRPALAGGLFAGTAWAAGGQVFAGLVVGASRYEAIYSGFAIVIVVMIWMYLSWLILLAGAQLAFYLQNPEYLRYGQRTAAMSNALREHLAISTMLLVGRDFDTPSHGWRAESLAAQIRVPRHLLEPLIAALKDDGLLTETTEQRLIPARDPRRIALTDILATVRTKTGELRSDRSRGWNPTVEALTQRVEDAIAAALDDLTLAELVDRDAAENEGSRPEAAPTGAAAATGPRS
ncbi:MAG TPA: YhjD/YihY/BrkB family envelope integrity protein [Gammaproteobacteria bacterium]